MSPSSLHTMVHHQAKMMKIFWNHVRLAHKALYAFIWKLIIPAAFVLFLLSCHFQCMPRLQLLSRRRSRYPRFSFLPTENGGRKGVNLSAVESNGWKWRWRSRRSGKNSSSFAQFLHSKGLISQSLTSGTFHSHGSGFSEFFFLNTRNFVHEWVQEGLRWFRVSWVVEAWNLAWFGVVY